MGWESGQVSLHKWRFRMWSREITVCNDAAVIIAALLIGTFYTNVFQSPLGEGEQK